MFARVARYLLPEARLDEAVEGEVQAVDRCEVAIDFSETA